MNFLKQKEAMAVLEAQESYEKKLFDKNFTSFRRLFYVTKKRTRKCPF